jgi:hypothetical protein
MSTDARSANATGAPVAGNTNIQTAGPVQETPERSAPSGLGRSTSVRSVRDLRHDPDGGDAEKHDEGPRHVEGVWKLQR